MRRQLLITLIVAIYNGIIYAHPFHTRSRMNPPRLKDSCSFSCDDLTSFISLAKILDDREPERDVANVRTIFNPEEIIMKLVNALIYATTHRIQDHCHCPHSVTPSIPSEKFHHNGGAIQSANKGNDHSNEGLLNLDLLNSNKKNNVLDLDLLNQQTVGVGLGTRNRDENSYSYTGYRNTNGNAANSGRSITSSEDLVHVSLLDSKQSNNVAAVNVGRQNVVGVGLGGSSEANGYGKQGETLNDNDHNEGLVNLQVLNPNTEDNVASLALSGQNVVGVGLGN